MKSNKTKNIGVKLLTAFPVALLYGLWYYLFSPDHPISSIVALICIAINGIIGLLFDKYYLKK